jgi:hypothetical protein
MAENTQSTPGAHDGVPSHTMVAAAPSKSCAMAGNDHCPLQETAEFSCLSNSSLPAAETAQSESGNADLAETPVKRPRRSGCRDISEYDRHAQIGEGTYG